MSEGDLEYDHAGLVEAISKALLEWAKVPEHACLGCGRIGLVPTAIRRDCCGRTWNATWKVDMTGHHVTDGWLRLEEYSYEPQEVKHVSRLLCPKCRVEKLL